MIQAKIIGAGGYGGVGITELLLKHPKIDIASLVSLSDTGRLMSDVFPHLKGYCDKIILSPDDPRTNEAYDLVIYATPDKVSMETAGDEKRAFILKEKLADFSQENQQNYDYILIDCPPSLSLLTVMALVSSVTLLVPLQTEFFALEGLTQLMKTIERVKSNLNPKLGIQGILLTMYDKRNKLSSEVEKEAREYFKDKVYNTVIPRNVRLSEAPSHGVPVLIYDKTCPGSKSYFSFTDEFLNKEFQIESVA